MENFFSIYSLIYIPLILCIFISDIKVQKKVMFFFIVVLTLFRGLRWDCGTDWYWYEQSFNNIDITNFWQYVTVENGNDIKILEVGWGFLLMVCKYLFGTYTSFLILTNLIQLVLLYFISTMFTARPIIVFIGFIASAGFFPVRQDLATMIYFFGFCWMLAKWKYSYFIYNGIAGLIHNSAWVLLPFYWVWKKVKLNYIWAISLLVISFLFADYFVLKLVPFMVRIMGSIAPQIAAVADNYFENEDNSWDNLSNPIFAFLLNLVFCTLFYKYVIHKKNLKLFGTADACVTPHEVVYPLVNLFIFGIMVLQLFLRTIPSLSRLADYSGLSQVVLFAILFDNIRVREHRLTAIFLYMMYLFYRYYKHFGQFPELFFPYRSIFGVLQNL